MPVYSQLVTGPFNFAYTEIDYEMERIMIMSLIEKNASPIIGIVGLGYVGLPVAAGFASKYSVIGFDINKHRIDALKEHIDSTGELSKHELRKAAIEFTTEEHQLRKCKFIIVAVPTPITANKEPDLKHLKNASAMIGKNLTEQTMIVYESTVYPGATEEICIPILESNSHLKAGVDFHVGYSPERINPGDKEHTFKRNIKVISAQNQFALDKISDIYQSVLSEQVYQAPSIKVAEAAKVVENTQRDVNIALMNELAQIFDKLHIDTYEVLQAAKTKWNFFPFTPGLVGGHCIGIDPFYLIYQSKMAGYHPQLLSTAREINDHMPEYIVYSLLKYITSHQLNMHDLCITVLGITFKENISDIRNSKSIEIIEKLQQLNLSIQVCDPYVSHDQFIEKGNVRLKELSQINKADIVILAVPHQEFRIHDKDFLQSIVKDDQAMIMDLKGIIPNERIPRHISIWKL